MLILQNSKQFCPTTRIIRREEYMVWEQTKRILEIAREKQKKLLDHANVQIQFMTENAQSECNAMREQTQAECEQQCQQQQLEMLFSMLEHGIDYFALLEQTFVQTLKEMFLKILGEYPPEERMYALVRQTIKTISEGKCLQISVHPEQMMLLKTKAEELIQQHPSLKHIEIIASKSLPMDSCLLETETGILDGTISVQLETLLKAIQARLH